MRPSLMIRIFCSVLSLGIMACAGAPEPETPPPVAPTKRAPRHPPLPPAPSNTPEVVYAQLDVGLAPVKQATMTEW